MYPGTVQLKKTYTHSYTNLENEIFKKVQGHQMPEAWLWTLHCFEIPMKMPDCTGGQSEKTAWDVLQMVFMAHLESVNYIKKTGILFTNCKRGALKTNEILRIK